MKRHQILGKELHTSWKELVELNERVEFKYVESIAGERTIAFQQRIRESRIEDAVGDATLKHLDFGPVEDLKSKLNVGMDRALEYFFGDWWVGNQYDEIYMNKANPERRLMWLGPFRSALILAGLTQRWSDIAKIAEWFDESVQLEYHAELRDDAYQTFFLCLASSFCSQPMNDFDEMIEAIKSSREKRPKLLCAAWEAALTKDQKTFNKVFKQSVQHFLKTHAKDVSNFNFWVALDQSIVWFIAEHNGLEFPTNLTDEQDAAVVRRQTIGLA